MKLEKIQIEAARIATGTTKLVSLDKLYQETGWETLEGIKNMHKLCLFYKMSYNLSLGWSGGAMVLGKLPVPGRSIKLDNSGARAYCACSRCGRGLFGHFPLIYHFSFLSPSLWETTRYRLK